MFYMLLILCSRHSDNGGETPAATTYQMAGGKRGVGRGEVGRGEVERGGGQVVLAPASQVLRLWPKLPPPKLSPPHLYQFYYYSAPYIKRQQ